GGDTDERPAGDWGAWWGRRQAGEAGQAGRRARTAPSREAPAPVARGLEKCPGP
ncbi:hypothetical protein HMPREF0298_1052, partial [Corynebacterium lipophiloflavum DSM 44291]